MYAKKQRFLIIGISKSGFQATKYLLSVGADCGFYEEIENSKTITAKKELIELGAKEITANEVENAIKVYDALIISPGVPINHPVAVKARALNKRIIGELELGYELFSPVFIAITGTNGKTTTATLLQAILKASDINSELVGNIGVPLTSKVKDADKNTVFVTEVSSFQLESVSAFKPHIACILNITPDHLERHYNMENYIFLKKRIFANQRQTEYAILNFDDETVKSFYTEIKANIVWVSTKEKVDGAYTIDGGFYFKNERVAEERDCSLSGEHNKYNILFAISSAKLMGVNNEVIAKALKEFKGVPFRMETVAEIDGVKFINDSKSTNTASAITAIKSSMRPTVLILGGSEKGEKYDELFETIKNSTVKHVVLTGAARRNMLTAADEKGFTNLTVCEDFDIAVKIAAMMADSGEEVLLSPACASFDKFSGYEERGKRFNDLVGELGE